MTAAVRSDGVASSRPRLWRISDRRTLEALRSAPSVRRGSLSVRFLPPDPTVPVTPPRVAFAVGKASGGAVTRNRIRRRLRAALRELAGREALPAGAYLLGGRADLAQTPWSGLVADLEVAVRTATEAGR